MWKSCGKAANDEPLWGPIRSRNGLLEAIAATKEELSSF